MELSQNKNTKDYASLLIEIKQQVKRSQLKAVISANSQMLYMYWYIGNNILQMQMEQGWGAKVVEELSKDLRNEFPENKDFSIRNLRYMRKFAEDYTLDIIQSIDNQSNIIMQAPLAQISWYHHITLMDKVKDMSERLWYKSDFAEQILKDPYVFDFVTIKGKADEKNIEDQLCTHTTKFLLELGQGFSFVGRQYHLTVADQDFYIDLLFYHIHLRCYVVVELKAVPFSPEQTGQLNFYVNAVNKTLKTEHDNQTIGLLLCKSKNETVAEYALGGINIPMGVADFQLSKAIPEELKSTLPSIEDLEKELEDI